jgi:hypothetical protein
MNDLSFMGLIKIFTIAPSNLEWQANVSSALAFSKCCSGTCLPAFVRRNGYMKARQAGQAGNSRLQYLENPK